METAIGGWMLAGQTKFFTKVLNVGTRLMACSIKKNMPKACSYKKITP